MVLRREASQKTPASHSSLGGFCQVARDTGGANIC